MVKNLVATEILAAARAGMGELVRPRVNSGVDAEGLLQVVDKAVAAGEMRECRHAGIWVLADDLERAHGICQEVGTAYGSAWHAVVHRRDGDFWNSKYWWRRAQGVRFAGLMAEIRKEVTPAPELESWLRGETYDGAGFVDLVERHAGRADLREALVAIQRLEWMSLFEECWRG